MVKKNDTSISTPEPGVTLVYVPSAPPATEVPAEPKPKNCIPPIRLNRNEFGLYDHTDYVFNDDGRVNWRAMIPRQYLYPNPQQRERLETKYGKPLNELNAIDDNLSDSELIVTLAGIRYLANLRGYSSYRYTLAKGCNHDYAAVVCAITWIKNYELPEEFVDSEGIACAHSGNTKGIFTNYLIELAENRAFCRCVRNFLNINIVSKEEIGSESLQDSEETVVTPPQILEKLMTQKKVSFETIKAKLSKEGVDTSAWVTIADVPPRNVFDIIGRLRAKVT